MTGGKLQLVVSTDVGRLLEAAADGFLRPLHATEDNPFPSPAYLLALRQGGVRDDLIRLAAQNGSKGWFDPPLCIFHELPKWLGEPDTPVLGDVERIALLGNVVRKAGGEVFGRLRRLDYYLSALDSFFGELVSEGRTPEEFAAATATLAQEPTSYAAQKRLELTNIYQAYWSKLAEAGVRDSRGGLVAAARLLSSDATGLAERLGGRREIRFYGLADLRGGWRPLLHSLVDSPAIDMVCIYTTRKFTASECAGLPPVDVTKLEDRQSIATALFSTREVPCQSATTGQFNVIEAPNTDRELGEVALRVRQLVDTGTQLHRIAVVARRGRPQVELAKRALEIVGVPATARIRISFSEIPVVKAISSLLAAASEGWTRQRLTELASQTHLQTRLDPRILNFIGYRKMVRGLQGWKAAIGELLSDVSAESRELNDEDEHSNSAPSSERVAQVHRDFEAFSSQMSELDNRRSLEEWIGWLAGFLENDPLGAEASIYAVPVQRHEAVKRDLAGWHRLRDLAAEWRRSIDRWGDVSSVGDHRERGLSVGEFSKRLQEMLDGQIGIWTATQRGVAVLESLAAAYREFDHVFLVGLEAGSFPLPAPKSPILDDEDRSRLRKTGFYLDTHKDWDFRERDLFRTVVSGAKTLTVSYPTVDARGKETIRSAFVEALADVAEAKRLDIDEFSALTPGTPIVSSDAAIERAVHATKVELERNRRVESPYAGSIEDDGLREWLKEAFDDNKLWSPSQIESYAKCPWAYFSGRLLGMERYEDPDEEMEPSVRGSLLHDTLARFYDRIGNERGRPVFLNSADLEWAEPLMEQTLDAAFDEMEQRVWMGHQVLRDFKRAELKRDLLRYLAWEVEHHERMEDNKKSDALILRTGASAHEQRFGENGDVLLERNGVSFKFRGSIDRVDVGVDPRIENPSRFVAAIDYKSSLKGVPGEGKGAAWDDGVVLQVPLYAYALTQILPDVEVSRVEYRPLREAKPGASPGKARPHCMQLYQVDKKTGVLKRDEKDAARMERALKSVCQHVLQARQGKFPVLPAPSCGCPPYCHAYDVCRVAAEARDGK